MYIYSQNSLTAKMPKEGQRIMERIESKQPETDETFSSQFETWTGKEFCGVGLIIFAGITFALLWMDRTTGLPFDMPAAWFKSKQIFFFLALFALP
ncbi:MAG: hypothetical protein KDA65_05475, partial [Planctomycetaceae bacterium]|nr:hypothetical protein [Planctomycetaceae bacterium]